MTPDEPETFIPKPISTEHAERLGGILRQTATDLGIDMTVVPSIRAEEVVLSPWPGMQVESHGLRMTVREPTLDELLGLLLRFGREHVASVLLKHQHRYDRDCGEDYGCSCGVSTMRTREERTDPHGYVDAIDTDGFALHLAVELVAPPTPEEETPDV